MVCILDVIMHLLICMLFCNFNSLWIQKQFEKLQIRKTNLVVSPSLLKSENFHSPKKNPSFFQVSGVKKKERKKIYKKGHYSGVFLTQKTWKNRTQKLVIIGLQIFLSTGPAAQTAQKQKYLTPKSPLMQDRALRLGIYTG